MTVTAPGYSAWSDASAVYELGHAGYGAPINRDVVTLYDATHAVTKYFDNGAWLVLGTVFDGNLLVDGDSVTLIKDLKVKGAGQTLKQGTVIKSIRLTENPEEIDCRHDAIKGLVLRTEFVRKR